MNMHIDLRTIEITPLRQTFDHLKERFGDKQPTRYQEGTYDLQQTGPFHYRPTWDPDHLLYDERRTRIRMRDWYDFKDPRQYYYGSYTIARAKQQESADTAFDFALSAGMVEALSPRAADLVLQVLVPARHAEWGANMNNMFMSAYGYGTAFEAPCNYAAMDRLGIAQQISRVGLAIGGEAALDVAKTAWLEASHWQPMRRYVEDSFVVKDWFELFVAQDLVLDALTWHFLYQSLRRAVDQGGGAFFGLCTKFMQDLQPEMTRWVDAITNTAVNESGENKALVQAWIAHFLPKATEAIWALAAFALPESAPDVVAAAVSDFNARLRKLGL
jgi:phenol/toluene 2-monooxygenase (NADH) P1/A1